MKHLTTVLNSLFFLCFFFVQNVSAQLVQVRIGAPPPPRVVVVERPPCPGRDYVWVEGHYVYDRYTRRDVWIPGQWEYAPPRCDSRGNDRHHHGRGRDYAPGQRKKYDRYYDR
ncbi:MAG: YXWGXW repeat-containing protein [Saprospiraceae bacterium]|nr:YXWGXW repeat-containing protein [Saprospiraceae bacterium]